MINFDKEMLHEEYPRPQMVRDSYLNLNGIWKMQISHSEEKPERFFDEILVPFCMESKVNGSRKPLQKNEVLWLKRDFTLPDEFFKAHCFLRFDAVDQCAEVFLNGVRLGSHIGGYTPFSFEITELMKSENELIVKVRDDTDAGFHSRGKQSSSPSGIWYTPFSGIWQSVWIESMEREYVQRLEIVPLFDEDAVKIKVVCNENVEAAIRIDKKTVMGKTNTMIKIPLDHPLPWTPEHPHLIPFDVQVNKDHVKSYFGMRKFSIETDSSGIKRLFLNNEPYFQSGLLDQGYNEQGIVTYKSDRHMQDELKLVKEMGFNMLRKHIKIEPLRWYYYCDKLGILVWQDMPNGGGKYNPIVISSPLITKIHFRDSHYKWFSRSSEQGRKQYIKELDEMLLHLRNCVSICMWVPFNEGWGQFDAKAISDHIRLLDHTRLIDHASGWHDQKIGDIASHHVYFTAYKHKKDPLNRAVVLSEFGGFNCRIAGHCYGQKDFGYKKMKSTKELAETLERCYDEQIVPAVKQGLSACVYTQLSDVESELNGLISYDRAVIKVCFETMKRINDACYAAVSAK